MEAADTVELQRHDWAWDELAAVTCCDQLTRDDRSLVELARLIQRKDAVVSVAVQIQVADELMMIVAEYPALVEHKDSEGLLPLHVAMENELSLEHIKILVDAHPASVTVKYREKILVDAHPASDVIASYRYEGEWQSAIRAARTVETREFLLDQAIRNLHSSLEHGWNDIHSFFKLHYNMEYVVQRLVEEFPGFLSKAWFYNTYYSYPQRTRLPLHYAIGRQAPVEVLEILVAAYPKALVTRDTCGETPLHVAIYEGHLESDVTQLLITSKSVRVCNEYGELPLHCYLDRHAATLDLEVIKSLVALFPKSIRATTKSGDTPLHIVCKQTRADGNRNMSVIQFLMERYPRAPLTMADCYGRTPICCICESAGEEQVILPLLQMLAEACPESVRQLDSSGNTVLHRYLLFVVGSQQASLSIVEYLARAYPDSLKIRDKGEKRTPLHIACERRFEDVVRFLATECPEVLESENGVETPLHRVCAGATLSSLPLTKTLSDLFVGDTQTLNILRDLTISEKAVKAKDSLGQTPLHLLSRVGAWQEFLRVIIEKSPAVVSIKDKSGRIPLHSAIEGCPNAPSPEEAYAYEDVVRYLLEVYPLGVHCMDSDGMTPLMLACESDASLGIIYQLVKVDPFSNQRCREWSQVPRHSPKKNAPKTNMSGSILWMGVLLATILSIALMVYTASPKEMPESESYEISSLL